MTEELLIEVAAGEVRAAILGDGAVVDLVIERRGRPSLVGNIYLGRVQRVLPGMNAAFVEAGIGRAGFLDIDGARPAGTAADAAMRIGSLVGEGDAVLVQVVRDAVGRKGVEFSRRIALPGRLLVLTPGEPRVVVSRQIEEPEAGRLAALAAPLADAEAGLIVRTAAAGAVASELAAEARALRAQWAEITAAMRTARAPARLHAEPDALIRTLRDLAGADLAAIRIDDGAAAAAARAFLARHLPAAVDRLVEHRGPGGLFEAHGVDEAIETARAVRVDLPSGGFVTIEPTEAITVIDVNSGSYVGTSRPAETIRRLNLEAVETIARQMRLRNLAGLIAIDFVNMEAEADWEAVTAAFRRAVADDRAPCRVIGRTAGGLFEVTRRRRREPLSATLEEACAACGGTGRVASAETLAVETIRSLERTAANAPPGALRVLAADAVVALLEGPYRLDFAAAVARTGRRVALAVRPGAGREAADIVLD